MNKNKYKILVTGASGFVGFALIKKLLSLDFLVIGLVRKKTNLIKSALYSEILIDDIKSYVDHINIKKIDIIIHLAAIAHTQIKNYKEYENTNVIGTKNITDLANRCSVKLIIMLSSIKVNGEGFSSNRKKYKEQCKPKPIDFYGKSKLESEKILIKSCINSNISYVILRSPIIYGEGVKGNLFNLMKYIYMGLPLPTIRANNSRSMLSLNNLIQAIILIFNKESAHNNTYLISDDTQIYPEQLYMTISKKFKKKIYIFKINKFFLKIILWPVGKSYLIDKISNSLIIDNSKVKQALNWSPSVSFDQEINNMVQGYIKKNG